MKLLLLVILSTLCLKSQAFPEMIRHGYTSCTACHVSPSGGGILTPYGRGLSAAALSTWKFEKEENLFHGLVPETKVISFGGDFRSLQMYRETSTTKDARLIFMQAELESAINIKTFTLSGAMGYLPSTETTPSQLITPKHYLLYQPLPELSFRFGKFMRDFGINTPEHTLAVKRRNHLTPGDQGYHLEGKLSLDPIEINLTGILGNLGQRSTNADQGFLLRGSYSFRNSKLGVNYEQASRNANQRKTLGLFFLWSPASSLSILSEWDIVWNETNEAYQRGFCHYLKADFEWTQGFHTYGLFESDWLKNGDKAPNLGLGIQFFPRPHFELNAQYQKSLIGEKSVEIALLLFHYYL